MEAPVKIRMEDTTTSEVAKRITRLREASGVVTLGRVLTLVISTDLDGVEKALDAANAASLEHPCRIIVLALGDRTAQNLRLEKHYDHADRYAMAAERAESIPPDMPMTTPGKLFLPM